MWGGLWASQVTVMNSSRIRRRIVRRAIDDIGCNHVGSSASPGLSEAGRSFQEAGPRVLDDASRDPGPCYRGEAEFLVEVCGPRRPVPRATLCPDLRPPQ